jgi:hypothetical protein
MQSTKPLISLVTPKLNGNGLSVYSGKLTLRIVLEQNMEIAKAFPQLPGGFYEVLNRRLKEKEFTDKRLMDAVNHVIDTCQYPVPTIANFISYDKNVQILTYADLVKQLNDDKGSWDYYDQIKVPGINKPRYARKEDVSKYNLQKWNEKN